MTAGGCGGGGGAPGTSSDGVTTGSFVMISEQPVQPFRPNEQIRIRVPDATDGATISITLKDAAGRQPAAGRTAFQAVVAGKLISFGPVEPGYYRVVGRTSDGKQGEVEVGVAASRLPPGFRDSSPFGIVGPPDTEADWKLCSEAGVAWLQWSLPWSSMEPRPGVYWFTSGAPRGFNPDALIETANSLGMRSLVQIRCTPTWASSGRIGSYSGTEARTSHYPPDDAHLPNFESFVRTAVSRFRPAGVRHFELWSEFPGSTFQKWNTEYFPKAEAYQKLLKHSRAALRKENPDAQLLGPGDVPIELLSHAENGYTETGGSTGGRGEYIGNSIAGIGKAADIATGHFYMTDWQSSPRRIWGPEFANPGRNGLTLRQIIDRCQKMAGTRPLWNTEIGYASGEALESPARLWTTEDEQANLLVRYYVYSLACGVKKVFWYRWRDNGDSRYGLLRSDGRPKPAYFAYRTMTDRLEGLSPDGFVSSGPDRWIVRFTGRRTVLVLWKTTPGEETVEAPAGWTSTRVTYRDGASSFQASSGRVRIALRGTEPVYLEAATP